MNFDHFYFSDNGEGAGNPSAGPKTFTQAEIDEIISKRLAREKKAWEGHLEEERKKAQMTTEEKLKAEKEEAEKRAQSAIATANERLLKAEVKATAVALGIIDPDAAFALMNRGSVTIDDKGEVQGIKEALEALVQAKPYLASKPPTLGYPPGNPPPPKKQDLDALIAEAESKKDFRLARELKLRKLAQHQQ